MKTRPRRTVLSPGWWRHQQGMTLGIVLIFMSLAVPLVTGALGLAGRLSVDSRIKTAIATSQYSTMGANEHALYRLLYQSGYASSLALNVADNYVLTLNGKAINVSVLKLGEVPGQPSPPSADNSRRLQTSKTVSPTTAVPSTLTTVRLVKTVDPNVAPNNTLTTFTYTVTLENVGSVVLNLSLIRNLLPAGFTYVADSTSGTITSANPTTTNFQGRKRLDWSFLPKVQFQPGETKTLVFQAQATLNGGDFWNEVWATFDEFANSVYTWPTALVKAAGVFEIAASDGQTKTSSELWIGEDFSSTQQWNLGK